MTVIGIDPGYGRLGYGLLNIRNRHPEYLTAGVIETNTQTGDGERLLEIENKLVPILKEYRPARAAVENVFFRKNLTTGVKLIEARGVILLLLARYAIPAEYVTPSAVKKAITGSGTAEKAVIQRSIARLLSLESLPKPDDAADGLALALVAWLRSLHDN